MLQYISVCSTQDMSQKLPATDRYLLPRGIQESCRLTAQHHLITQRLGGLLHPVLVNEIRWRKDLAIADAGCGNGIWAVEVASEYPMAKVVAIDVSDAQFPPSWTCPDNCRFRQLDLMQPIDAKYVSSFDLINVRLLAGPLDARDYAPIINNLFRMLKRDGLMQWIDILSPGIRAFDSSEVSDETRKWKQPPSISTHFPAFIRSIGWLEQLPEFLKQRGFVDVETHDCPPRRALLKHETDDIALVLTDLVKASPDVDLNVVEKFKVVVAELMEDISEGRMFTVVL